jgi:Zn-dependent oligopeptidase
MFTLRASHAKPDGGYQPSLLALVCNFGNGVPGTTPLLSSFELETLFHELGHAMHTLLSRTHFQVCVIVITRAV